MPVVGAADRKRISHGLPFRRSEPYLSPMPNPRLFDRAIIRLSPTGEGEDLRGFLQGLVTQDTTAELPLWAGLLSPQGKALFDFIMWADGADEMPLAT